MIILMLILALALTVVTYQYRKGTLRMRDIFERIKKLTDGREDKRTRGKD